MREAGGLDECAGALAAAVGAPGAFTVVASVRSLWVWLRLPAEPDLDRLRDTLTPTPGVRVALGAPGTGIGGFRSSHLEALAAQRLMHRRGGDLQLAAYPDVRLVVLATQDEEQADDFVRQTLGGLLAADPELRETMRVYLREGSSTSAAARSLFAHRNTVLARLGRAEQLLPAPLAGRGLEVGLALEIVHWLGDRA